MNSEGFSSEGNRVRRFSPRNSCAARPAFLMFAGAFSEAAPESADGPAFSSFLTFAAGRARTMTAMMYGIQAISANLGSLRQDASARPARWRRTRPTPPRSMRTDRVTAVRAERLRDSYAYGYARWRYAASYLLPNPTLNLRSSQSMAAAEVFSCASAQAAPAAAPTFECQPKNINNQTLAYVKKPDFSRLFTEPFFNQEIGIPILRSRS